MACRQLGFASGAEVVDGMLSALPGPAGVTDGVSGILYGGGEQSISQCEIFREYAEPVCDIASECNVALLCSNPSGALQ